MSTTYADTVTRVRDWANRDTTALPDTVIQDCLRWAADKAYRTLRVPPLEQTYRPASLTRDSEENAACPVFSFAIPGDLNEFIQIREIPDNGNGRSRVFNEKTDIRTFRDTYSEIRNDYSFWTRERDCILLGGFGLETTSTIELYYYRRLPALNGVYEVTLENYRAGRLRTAAGVVIPADANYTAQQFSDLPATTVGAEAPHWLRDENERILLFGALSEAFAYLQEEDQVEKYRALFFEEITELNKEDAMLRASGGNIQMNFNGRGLI